MRVWLSFNVCAAFVSVCARACGVCGVLGTGRGICGHSACGLSVLPPVAIVLDGSYLEPQLV